MFKSRHNEVPIVLQTQVTSFLNVAYPLCFILAEPKLTNWYYEHFIHIFCQNWDELGILRLDYLDSSRFFGDILDVHFFNYSEVKEDDILSLIREKVDAGYCLNIFTLDEFYLDQRPAYQKYHFIHETLVYGYDDARKKVLVIGYNKINLFTKFEYDYKQFRAAFKAGFKNPPEYLPHPLSILKLHHFSNEYPFDLDRFINELHHYYDSFPDTQKKFFAIGDKKESVYGFEIYRQIIAVLQKMIEGDVSLTINYTAIHFLYEHKKLLMERFQWVQDKYQVSPKLPDLIHQFAEIEQSFNANRLNWLEQVMLGSTSEHIYETVLDKADLQQMLEMITAAQAREYELLHEILTVFSEVRQSYKERLKHEEKSAKISEWISHIHDRK